MGIQADVLSFVHKKNRQLVEYELKDVNSIFFNEYVPYDGSFDADEEIKEIKAGDYLVKYQVKNRTITTPPKLSNATQNKGVVAVDVVVDKYGIVRSVKSGAAGSTTSSDYLYIKAEFAVKGIRFNEDKTGPLQTKGVVFIQY